MFPSAAHTILHKRTVRRLVVWPLCDASNVDVRLHRRASCIISSDRTIRGTVHYTLGQRYTTIRRRVFQALNGNDYSYPQTQTITFEAGLKWVGREIWYCSVSANRYCWAERWEVTCDWLSSEFLDCLVFSTT